MGELFKIDCSKDLSLINAGEQKCAPGYEYSYFLTDWYLIHFIISGKGTFTSGGKTHRLDAGNAFLIMPGEYSVYKADEDDPWHYTWFHFSGNVADVFINRLGLSAENPIYKTGDTKAVYDAFCNLLATSEHDIDFLPVGAFFSLLGTMLETSAVPISKSKRNGEEYVELCKEYIKLNHYRKISVEQLCRAANIDRTYLFRLFKVSTGKSPKDYIIDYKMQTAKKLFETSGLSVSQVAQAVGYDDAFAFSKLFKNRYGVSPKQFSKNFMHTSITPNFLP